MINHTKSYECANRSLTLSETAIDAQNDHSFLWSFSIVILLERKGHYHAG